MINKRGFTLTEVVVAVTILFIIGTVFIQFFITSQKGTVQSQEKLEALNIAQVVLERVKHGEEYNEINGVGTFKCTTSVEDCNEKYIFQNETSDNVYEIEIEVKEHDLDLYLVMVNVKSADGEGKSSVKGLVEL